MDILEFLNHLPDERKETLTAIHQVILAKDPNVIPSIKPMMGMEMILYEEHNYMKYGLASAKNHMSLHCMPIYMNPTLHAKFVSSLPGAKFQKGCVNFTNGEMMPTSIVAGLIAECSTVNIADILKNRKKK